MLTVLTVLKSVRRVRRIVPITLLLVILPGGLLQAQSLNGSPAVMDRQNRMAISYGYSFLKTSQDVRSFYENGYLVKVTDSDTLTIHNVSYPYARDEVKLFLERLSRQYLNACGEKLVVTSLTRPLNKQPRNASDVSVHPTGMALDLRIPRKSKCRSWLQSTLLSLERSDVLDVTRERRPPHFHVALFTKSYGNYVAALEAKRHEPASEPRANPFDYTVSRGDSLYLIAEHNHTTIEDLRTANNLRSNVLQIGQVLTIPAETGIEAETGTEPAADTPPPVFIGPTIAQVAGTSDQATVPENTLPDLMDDAGQAEQQTQPQDMNYTVRRGDSLYLIAERNDTTIEALRAANNLRSIVLQVGQELTIPGDIETTLAMASAPDLIHRVRRGDTLWDIASEYRVSINRLMAMNGLLDEVLQVGQVLKVSGN